MSKTRNYVKTAITLLLFLCLVTGMLHVIDNVVIAKDTYAQAENETETYKGFYAMQEDTIDVLIVGTSHAATAVNPNDIYAKAQVRSYNLASGMQTMRNSYFWVQEALQYQHPSAVILDVNYLFDDINDEAAARKALDNMHYGMTKYVAVRSNVDEDAENDQSLLSYFLPYIRYHSRWNDLSEYDYLPNDPSHSTQMKGYWEYHWISGYEDYAPSNDDDKDPEPFGESGYQYLEMLRQLCEDNGIQLILIKTPAPDFVGNGKHRAVADYANAHDLPFYDFNTTTLYNAIGFDFPMDTSNAGWGSAHTNPYGARKISYYLADELVNNGWATPTEDEQWASSQEYNDNDYKDFELAYETDLHEYLQMLGDRHTICIAVQGDAGSGMTDDIRADLAQLGLQATWDDAACGQSYVAIIELGQVTYEEMSDDVIDRKTTFRNGQVRLAISSAGSNAGNDCSIRINDKEYATDKGELNIVVYSNDRNCVIDAIAFDMDDAALTGRR